MRHLSTDERLALIEVDVEPRHPHLAACEGCRRDVADGRATRLAARDVGVPEPSPLFWEHFSARVSARLDAEPVPETARASVPWRLLAPLAAGVALLIVLVAVNRTATGPAPASDGGVVVPAAVTLELADAPAEDEGWSMLGHLAGDFDVETLGDSLGHAPSGGADSIVWQLSEGERAELGRLLEAEMPSLRSGS